jgi:hypothetical protein
MLTIIVEGTGEEYALPVLIDQGHREHLLPDLPDIQYLVANGKPYILQYGPNVSHGMEGFIYRYIHATGCQKFIVLLDADRTCPPYLRNDDRDLTLEYREMPLRARQISERYGVEVVVCWAKLELESWLIGGLRKGAVVCDESLGQFTIRFAIPEDTSIRPLDPKSWLLKQFSKRKETDYTPSVVECLALHVNIQDAYRHNSTLREFFNALNRMADSALITSQSQ